MAQEPFLGSLTLKGGRVTGYTFQLLIDTDLPLSPVVPGTYSNVTVVVDQYGRITSVNPPSPPGTPVDAYVTENGLSYYVIENQTAYYVQERPPSDHFGFVTENLGTDYQDIGWGQTPLLIQPDYKVLLAGTVHTSNYNVFVIRYNTNGTRDSTWGTGGIVQTDVGDTNDLVGTRVIILQPDGKVVCLVGAKVSNDVKMFLLRYTSIGVLDTSFGTGGILTVSLGNNNKVAPWNMQMDLVSSKFYVTADRDTGGGQYDFCIYRVNPNGTLDTSFGTGGSVVLVHYKDYPQFLVMEPPDVIYTAGDDGHFGISGTNTGILKLHYDGSFYSSFGTSGLVLSNPTATQLTQNFCLLSQADGKLLLAGLALGPSGGFTYPFILARYNLDGSLDTSFNSTGFAYFPSLFGSATADYLLIRGMALATGGKIVVVIKDYGTNGGGNGLISLIKVNTNGTLDSGFGVVSLPQFPTVYAGGYIAIRPDGKMVVASVDNDYIIGIGCYNTNGTLDT